MHEFVVNGSKDGLVIKVQVTVDTATEAGLIAVRDYGLTAISTVVRLAGTSSAKIAKE